MDIDPLDGPTEELFGDEEKPTLEDDAIISAINEQKLKNAMLGIELSSDLIHFYLIGKRYDCHDLNNVNNDELINTGLISAMRAALHIVGKRNMYNPETKARILEEIKFIEDSGVKLNLDKILEVIRVEANKLIERWLSFDQLEDITIDVCADICLSMISEENEPAFDKSRLKILYQALIQRRKELRAQIIEDYLLKNEYESESEDES